MTLDERIEALTQSVELLALMHKDHEARVETYEARMDARLDKLAQEMNSGFMLVAGTLQIFGAALQKVAVATEMLTKIAQDHENQLKRAKGSK